MSHWSRDSTERSRADCSFEVWVRSAAEEVGCAADEALDSSTTVGSGLVALLGKPIAEAVRIAPFPFLCIRPDSSKVPGAVDRHFHLPDDTKS